MPEPEQTAEVVRGWVTKAEHDLVSAVRILMPGKGCPTDMVCYHAQQCIEKYVKALLAQNGIAFPKTHDLDQLSRLLPAQSALDLPAAEWVQMTEYAAGVRYPGWGEISLSEARAAVAVARRVKRAVRRLLPRMVYYQISKQ